MRLLDMKWRRYKKEQMVALVEPVFVKRVGYEVDHEVVMNQLARDASHVPPEDPTGWENDHKPRKEYDLHVVSGHPQLQRYFDDRDGLRRHLDSLLLGAIGHDGIYEVLTSIDHAIVRRMVKDRMQKVVRQGNLRVIEYEPGSVWTVPEGADEKWRGPWSVLGWRVAFTGIYQPGWQDHEEGGEGPSIENAKAHVLLLIAYQGGGNHYMEQKVVLKENTMPWANLKVAQTLMVDGGDR